MTGIKAFPPGRHDFSGVIFWDTPEKHIATSRDDAFVLGKAISRFGMTREGKESNAAECASYMACCICAAQNFYAGELARLRAECPFAPGDAARLKKPVLGGDALVVEQVAGFLDGKKVTYALVGTLRKKDGKPGKSLFIALESAIAGHGEGAEK